ncbi:MAG TPA: ABC transporter permease, partial [Vicinamibacterales bacterium]|nr:ABC transporter permease [Vicinamibacterales bacterium]
TGAVEALALAVDSLRSQKARAALAVAGIVIGIITVVLVATVLAGVRNGIAALFRELGTDNVFAFHRAGDPYTPSSDRDAQNKPLEPSMARAIAEAASSIREVAAQIIVPPIADGRPLVARRGTNESDTVLIEGATPNFFDVAGAEFRTGRPFTPVEDSSAAKVAVIGSSVARALFGGTASVGKSFTLAGDAYSVVGELEPRKGGFFGENRQDNVITIPAGTVARRFPDARITVLYARTAPGQLAAGRAELEFLLRRMRGLPPGADNDFTLSTAEQIISNLDAISAQIGLAAFALALVSLVIGGIGIANVMIIAVTERTREIGTRLAIGAKRRDVLAQFLVEAALLSAVGGGVGVAVSWALGFALSLAAPAFPAVPPLWAVAGGLGSAVGTGLVAGYLPARRAANLDPVEALRYE